MIGLAALQLLPGLRLLPEMGRTSGIDYESAARWSLQFRDLLAVFFPRAFADLSKPFEEARGALLWEKVSYVGLALPLLAPLGFVALRRRSEVLFLGALAVAALLLAFGEYLPFYQAHYLLFSGFRYPGRLLPLWSLAIGVLGAAGCDALLAWAGQAAWRRRAWAFAGTVAVLTLAAIAFEAAKPRSGSMLASGLVFGSELFVVVGTALVLVAAVWLAKSHRWLRALYVALVMVVALDLTTFGGSLVLPMPEPRHEAIAEALRADDAGRVLTACKEGFSPFRMTNVLVPMVDGANSAFLRDYARFSVLIRGERVPPLFRLQPTIWGETPRRFDLVDVLNVTHVAICTPLNVDRFQLIGQVNELLLYRNAMALPRAYWTCGADLVDSDDAAIQLLADRQRDVRTRTVMMREPGMAADPDLAGCQDTARVQILEQDTPTGELVVQVDAPTRGVLFMSEVHYPERRIWVDGVEAPAMAANLAFLAVVLEPGVHRVELRLVPTAFMVGAGVSLVSLVLLAALMLRWNAGGGRSSRPHDRSSGQTGQAR
jgi:hypothetical protein